MAYIMFDDNQVVITGKIVRILHLVIRFVENAFIRRSFRLSASAIL